jgi:hypothetical protein
MAAVQHCTGVRKSAWSADQRGTSNGSSPAPRERALRRHPHPRLTSGAAPARGPSVVDKGFEGRANPARGWQTYGAQILWPPKRNRRTPWPTSLRRWLAGVRQIVDTVYDKLFHPFRQDRERRHEVSGCWTRLAATITLHNCCI